MSRRATLKNFDTPAMNIEITTSEMSEELQTFLEFDHPGNVPVWEKLTFTKELVNGVEEIRPISSSFYYGPDGDPIQYINGEDSDGGSTTGTLGRESTIFIQKSTSSTYKSDFIGIWDINGVQHIYYAIKETEYEPNDEEPRLVTVKTSPRDEFQPSNFLPRRRWNESPSYEEKEPLYLNEIDINYDLDQDGVIGYPAQEKYIQLYDFLLLEPKKLRSKLDSDVSFDFDFTGSDVSETILIRGENSSLEAYADGKGGNDKIDVDTDFVIEYMEAYGGEGDDTLKAKAAISHIFGGVGNDTISIKKSDDLIFYPNKKEAFIYVHGGEGDDVIKEDDKIFDWWKSGDVISDFIGWLGEGNDNGAFPILLGEAGDDELTGYKLSGGSGNDELTQPRYTSDIGDWEGSTYLFGGSGNDALKLTDNSYNETIVPTIELSSGKDTIILENQREFKLLINSTIYGNEHTITTEYDPDSKEYYSLIKGGGIETRIASTDPEFLRRRLFYVEGPEENGDNLEIIPEDTEEPIAGDKLYIPPVVTRTFEGTQQADKLKGKKTNDELLGYGGKDQLNGKKGHDILRGQKGNDTLKGKKGGDFLMGGKGDDELIGGKGPDVFMVSQGIDKVMDFTLKQGDRIAIDIGAEYTVGSYEVLDGSTGTIVREGDKKALFISGLPMSEFNQNISEIIVRIDPAF